MKLRELYLNKITKVKKVLFPSKRIKRITVLTLGIIVIVLLYGCSRNNEQNETFKEIYKNVKESENSNDFKEEESEQNEILENISENSISLGNLRSAAITKNDELFVWGWGQNDEGKAEQMIPRKILENTSYIELGNDYLSAAIDKKGDLYMWDYNDGGKLFKPQKVMSGVIYVAVGGGSHEGFADCAAITRDHSLYLWYGKDANSAYKVLDDCIQVSLGEEHGMALTSEGSLYVWGYGFNGQLGNGTHSGLSTENEPENGYYQPFKLMENIRYIECGNMGSAAITYKDELYVWGSNTNNALGVDEVDDKKSVWRGDVIIPIKTMNDVKYVEMNNYTGCAVLNNGDLYTWGYYAKKYRGFLKDAVSGDYSVPTKIRENVRDVSIGEGNLAVLTNEGKLYMYGENTFGQVGNGTNKGVYDDVIEIMDNIRVLE